MHITTVVDLREPGKNSELERQTVEALGMKYVNIPMSAFSAPTNQELARALSLLVHDSQPVFVHCWRGKDRTGTVVACYRIQHDGWDNRRALAEAKKYGMSMTERGMRHYILKFKPLALPDTTVLTK